MMEFHLDPVGGIAGDMFVAGILDVRPDLEPGLREVLALCPLIENVSVDVVTHNDGTLTGRRFLVALDDEQPTTASDHHDHHHGDDHHGHHHHHGEDHHHGHEHHAAHHSHTAWRDIRLALENAPLDRTVIEHAIGIFSLLAEAEARVHGTTPDDISFHEVGAWDSITDIVSAAYLIASLDAERWTVGPIPLGSGRVRTAHGILPVPAPATSLLLEGFSTIDDGIAGERVTPTGAAILKYLCQSPASRSPRKLMASGHGFGTKTMPGISNCLRVLVFETAEQVVEAKDEVAVIEFEIDDQTGEDLAQAIDHLRVHEGVLDVIQAVVFGKKGRMMAHVRILARPDALQSVSNLVFAETSTIGIRHSIVQRTTLPRVSEEIKHDGRPLRIKAATRPGGVTVKVEADDLGDIAGKAARDAIRATVETSRKGRST